MHKYMEIKQRAPQQPLRLKKKSKGEIKKIFRQTKIETTDQNLWNITELGLCRKFIKTSNKQHNFTPQGTRKKRTNEARS